MHFPLLKHLIEYSECTPILFAGPSVCLRTHPHPAAPPPATHSSSLPSLLSVKCRDANIIKVFGAFQREIDFHTPARPQSNCRSMHTLNSKKKEICISGVYNVHTYSRYPADVRLCVFNLISAASTHDIQIPVPALCFGSAPWIHGPLDGVCTSSRMQVTFSIANQRTIEAALIRKGGCGGGARCQKT